MRWKDVDVSTREEDADATQIAVVLEGLDGVADFTAQKQQAFEAWITRVARQAHEDRDREVTVVLEYMQELRGVDSDDPPTPSPSKLEPVEPPSRLQPLLVNGFAIGAYVVLRTLMLNSAAQAIRSGPSGGGTIDEGGGELRGASGAPPGVRLQARALVEGRAAAVGGTVVDTHAVAEGNGETSEGNAGEGKRSPTRYVVMACQVHVSDNNDATGGEVSKESAAKEARQMLAERLNGGQLSQLAELAELLNGGDLQMNMPACEDAVSGLRATPRLGLPTHKANPAWRIANNTPEHSNAITTVDKLPGMLFLLSSALLDLLLCRGLTIALVVQKPDLLVVAAAFFSAAVAFTVMRLFWFVRQAANIPASQASPRWRGLVQWLWFGVLLLNVVGPVTHHVATTVVTVLNSTTPGGAATSVSGLDAALRGSQTPPAAKKNAKQAEKSEFTCAYSDFGVMLQQQQKLAAQARSGHISLIAGAEFNSEKKLTLTINEKAPSAQLWFTNHPGVKKFSVYLPPSNLTPTLLSSLEAAGVKISAALPVAEKQNWLLWFLTNFGPLVLYIFLFRYLLSTMADAQGGQSAKDHLKEAEGGEMTKTTLDDVAGCDEAKAELQEVIDFLKDPTRYAALGARAPKGVLLVGPPGTGKTLLARAVAGSASVPFFSAAASSFDDMYVGVGASRIRKLFKRAREAAPSILFIDEIDALGGTRRMGRGNDSQTLNQLLTEMDGFATNAPGGEVIVLAATNQPEALDAALRRPGRFDRTVSVSNPALAGRQQVLGVHARLSGVRLRSGTDLAEVAKRTMGFSAAGLQNLINEAALLAARERALSVGPEHFAEGVERVIGGIERPSLVVPARERLTVAVHECGHALVGAAVAAQIEGLSQQRDTADGWLRSALERAQAQQMEREANLQTGSLPRADKAASVRRSRMKLPTKVSIIPRGDSALGYTMTQPLEDQYLYSEDELRGQLAMLMGGRAAERLVFRMVTSGASDDLKRATELAEQIVGELGMAMGPRVLYDKQGSRYLGNEGGSRKAISETVQVMADNEISRLLEGADQLALKVLQRHKPLLDAMVEQLMQEEVLEGTKLESWLTPDNFDVGSLEELKAYLGGGK